MPFTDAGDSEPSVCWFGRETQRGVERAVGWSGKSCRRENERDFDHRDSAERLQELETDVVADPSLLQSTSHCTMVRWSPTASVMAYVARNRAVWDGYAAMVVGLNEFACPVHQSGQPRRTEEKKKTSATIISLYYQTAVHKQTAAATTKTMLQSPSRLQSQHQDLEGPVRPLCLPQSPQTRSLLPTPTPPQDRPR